MARPLGRRLLSYVKWGYELLGRGSDRSFGRLLAYAIVLVFLGLFLVYPLFFVLKPAFVDGSGRLTLRFILEVLSDERSTSVISFTLSQALISTLITLVLAFPGAYILARYRFPGRSVLLSLTTVPFVLPPLVLAIGFLSLFGTQGTVNTLIDDIGVFIGIDLFDLRLMYTKKGIIVAHVFLNFPLALRILHSRLVTVERDLLRASRSLGAGPFRTFYSVLLPQMRYSLLSAASLVFTFCLLTFGAVLVIGGMKYATIEVEIYRQFIGLFDEHRAGALLFVEIVIVAFSTAVYIWSSARSGTGSVVSMGRGVSDRGALGEKRNGLGWKWVPIALYAVLIGIVILGPMASVVHDSFVREWEGEESYSLHWYGTVLSREDDPTVGATPIEAIENSLLFGILTVAVAVPLSVAVAVLLDHKKRSRVSALGVLMLFPLGVSTVALGLGMVSAYDGGVLDMTGTWMIVLAVHVLIAYPLGARAVLSARRSIPAGLNRAARSLGASPLRAFTTIDLPLMLPGILVAAVFAFAISVGEFGATLMVSSNEYTTMPVALYRFVSGGRDLGAATAYSSMMIGVTFISFLVIDLLGKRISGRFRT